MITIAIDTLFRVHRFCAQEIRYSLSCVEITSHKGGTRAVATNGHAIGIEHDPYLTTPTEQSVLLKPNRKWKKYLDRADTHYLRINPTTAHIDVVKYRTIVPAGLPIHVAELPPEELDGAIDAHSSFPRWDCVIPDLNKLEPYVSSYEHSFDPKLLALFPTDIGRKPTMIGTIRLWKPFDQERFEECIFVTVSRHDEDRIFFVGSLMEIRSTLDSNHHPSKCFLTVPLSQPSKEEVCSPSKS